MTDKDILALDNVSPKVAAKYLDTSVLSVYYALQQGVAPYGYAVKNPGGKYSYHISPGLLVAYKNGNLKINFTPRGEEQG